ncbi:MAG: molybdopterin cofactor-binding domain-containing protein [Hyphomicrobiales bacterium]
MSDRALSQLMAEELRVELAAVRMVMGDTDFCPFDIGTFGGRSTPDAGLSLRIAAATARKLLVKMAASRWGIQERGMSALDGIIRDRCGRAIHLLCGDLEWRTAPC